MALVFDPHEKVNGNFFTDEAGVVFSGKNYRVLVPKNGPFYTNSLVVKCAGKELRPGNDYVPTHLYRRSVLNTGRSTHGLIWLTNAAIEAEEVTITYHAVGIGLATQAQIEAERKLNEDTYPHLCSWESVIGEVYFPPVDIQFDWENWKGEQELMNAIAEIAAKITEKPAAGEPEPIDKTMMMVERYYQIVERLFRNAPAHAHILDKNNPHKDFSCARMGAVTLDGVVNDTNKAYGKTLAELTTHVNNASPTSAAFADKMLRHATAPRQITGTFKMFDGLSSVSGRKLATDGEADSAVMVNSKAVRFIGKDSTVIDAGNNPIRFKTKGGELVLWNDERGLQWNGKPLLDPISVLPHLPGTSGSSDGVFYGTSSPSVNVTGNGISTAPFTCTWIAPDSVNLNVPALRLLTDEFGSSETLVATPALIQKLDDAFKPTEGGTDPAPAYDPIGTNIYLQDKATWDFGVSMGKYTFAAGGVVNINTSMLFRPEFKGMDTFDNDLVFSVDKSLMAANMVSIMAVTTWYDPAAPADFVMLSYGVDGYNNGQRCYGTLYTKVGSSTNTYTFSDVPLGLTVNKVDISLKHKWDASKLVIDMLVNGDASQVTLDKNNLTGPVGNLFNQYGLARFLAGKPVVKYNCANMGSLKVIKLTGTKASTGPELEPVKNISPISRLTNLVDEDAISFQTVYNSGALVWDGNFDYHTYPTSETPFKVVQEDCGPGVLDHSFVCTGGAKAGGDKTYYSGVRGMWFGNPANELDYMRYMISVAGGRVQYALVLMKDSHQTDLTIHTDTYTELPKTARSMTVRTYCSHTADGVEYKVYVEGKLVSNFKLEFKNLPQAVSDFLAGSGAASWFGTKLKRSMVLNVASQSKITIHGWPGLRMDMYPQRYEPISLSPRLLTATDWAQKMGNSYWKNTRYSLDGGPFAPNGFTFDLAVKSDFQIKLNYWANMVASASRRTFELAFRWQLGPASDYSYLDLMVYYEANVARTRLIHRAKGGATKFLELEQHTNAYPTGAYKGVLDFRVAQGYVSTYCTVHPTVFSSVSINTANPAANVVDFLTPLGLLETIKKQPDELKVKIYDPYLTVEVETLNDSNVTPVYGPIKLPVDPRVDPIGLLPQRYPTNHPYYIKSYGLIWEGKGRYKALYSASMDVRLGKVPAVDTEVKMFGVTKSWAEELPIFGYVYFDNPANAAERIGFGWTIVQGNFSLSATYNPGYNPVNKNLMTLPVSQVISDGTKEITFNCLLQITQVGRVYRIRYTHNDTKEIDVRVDFGTLTGELKAFIDGYGAAGWIKDTPDGFVFANSSGAAVNYEFLKICGTNPADHPSLKDPFTNNQYLVSGKQSWLAALNNKTEWANSRFYQSSSSQVNFKLDLKRDFSARMTVACPTMILDDGMERFSTTFQSAFRWIRPNRPDYLSWIEYGIVMSGQQPVNLTTYVAYKNEDGEADWCILEQRALGNKGDLYNFLIHLTPSWSPTFIGAHSTMFGSGFSPNALPADIVTFLSQYSWAKDLMKSPPDEYELSTGFSMMTIIVDSITGADMGLPDYTVDPEGAEPLPEGGGTVTPVTVEYLPRLKSFVNGLSLANPVTLDKNSFGLGNVYDMADTELPVSTAQAEYIKDKAVIGHTHTTEEFGIRESVDGNMGTVQFAGLVDDATKALDSSLVPPQADTITELEKLGSTAATKPMLNIIRYGKTGDAVIVGGVTSTGWMLTIKANVYFVGKEYAVPLKTFNLAELFPTDHAENSFGIYVDLVGNVAEYKVLRNDNFPENSTLSRIGGFETSDVGIGSATVRNRTRLGAFEQLVNHVSDVNAHSKHELTKAEYGYQHTQALPAWNAASLTVNRFDADWRMFDVQGPVPMEKMDCFSGGFRFQANGLAASNHRFILHNAMLRSYEGFVLTPVPNGSGVTTIIESVIASYLDGKGIRHRFSVIFNRANAVTASDGRLCYAALAIDYGSQNQVLIGLSSTAFTTADSWLVLKPTITTAVRRQGSVAAGFMTELEAIILYGTTTVTVKVEIRKGTVVFKEARIDTGVNATTDITSRLTQMGIEWDKLVFAADGSDVDYGSPLQFGMGGRFNMPCNMGFATPAGTFVRVPSYLTALSFIEDISDVNRYRVVEVGGHITPDTMRANVTTTDFAKRVDNPNGRPAYLNKQRLNLFVDKGVCKALIIRD